jgi:apolipoprotein N-acyltransferase
VNTRLSACGGAASGALLVLSFPKYGHPAFAWIALAPLLVALVSARSARHAFTLGLVTGVVYFTGTLYWITRVMVLYGALQVWVAVLVNAALIAYLALYPAVFGLVMHRLLVSYGRLALMASPFVWVTTELGRTHLFTGFPWVLLGYSQTPVLAIAQLASVFGVFGVSALVAAVSAALAWLGVPLPGARRRAYTPLSVMILLVFAIGLWGSIRVGRAELTRTGDAMRVGLIQGNVDQAEKWDEARAARIFADYLQMTRQAIREGAEMVFWPESATPRPFEDDSAAAEQLRTIAREAHVPILFGSDQIEWKVQNNLRVPDKYYNSAYLVLPDGTTGGVYRKMHLVPFGEYVPLKRVFFFAKPLVEAVSDFAPGDEAALLPVRGHLISAAICYEIVYPDLVRRFVQGGSELLTTITNDAWFGRTSAPYQHFEQAAMRAIEEGRYLVRSANTGISGIVDPYGRVLVATEIFQPAVTVGAIRFLRARTMYAAIGDVFAYASVLMTAALLVAARGRVE